MARKRIRLGLIGCGSNMRGAHLPRLARDGAVDIVALADPVVDNAEAIAEEVGGAPVIETDWRKLLDASLDAVVISTPHDRHFTQVKSFLSSGRHVLIEKPLTPKPGEARALLELASRKRRRLVVSYQRHFQPTFVYARELIRKGEIGRIQAASVYVTQNWGAAGGWRLDPRQSGGGMFIDTGSHLVAAMLWLTGLAPKYVFSFSDNARHAVDIDTVVSIRFANGALGSLDTIGSASRHDERIAIHGSRGSMILDSHQWRGKPLVVNNEARAIPARIKPDSPDEAFLGYIRGRKGYRRPDYALQVANLSHAVYQSARTGKVARVR